MSVPAINITPDTWLDRAKAFPLSLPEAVIWLALAYMLPQMIAEQLQLTAPEGWYKYSPQMLLRGGLALILLGYFFIVRKGRADDLGWSVRRLPADILWGVTASLAMGALYLGGMALAWLGVIWWYGRPDVFWAFVRNMPMQDLSLGHILAVCIAAPILEEFWFRSLLYAPLRLYVNRAGAILLLSVVFAAAHGWPPITQFIGGIAFAYAYEKRQSIWASIILHIAGNSILFVMGWAVHQGLLKL
ncbi:MAG: CPBP family intramembrane metalloprotease [Planctomycetes bacterium]|nr:CPBP family intramembrane metalloprotease [Planctomycetota bacterium]